MIDCVGRSEILRMANLGTEIIGFGAGELGEKTQLFVEGRINYFVDNYRAEFGESYAGNLEIRKVDTLSKVDTENSILVICSEHYEEIQKQVLSINKKFKIYLSPLLKNFDVFQKVNNSSRNVLISSYGADGGIYLMNTNSGEYNCLQKGSFRGLTPFGEKYLVAEEFGNIWLIDSIKPYSSRIVFKSDHICQSHGIVVDEDQGLLYKIDSSFDKITIINTNNFIVVGEILFEVDDHNIKTDLEKLDQFHLNDICLKDGYLYVSCLSETGNWKKGILDGCVFRISTKDTSIKDIFWNDLLYPHSVSFVEDKIIVLEALRGEICWRDKGKTDKYFLPGFLRGICSDKNLFYVGQSRNRHIDRLKYQSTNSMEPGIYVISKKEKVFKFLKLPEYCDIYHIHNLEC